jgi:flagellar biosynthesis chaperone FliJ
VDAIWVVIFSTVIPAAIVFAGQIIERRRGVPANVDASIDSHVQFVIDRLNDEIEERKQDAADCQMQLDKERTKWDGERTKLRRDINSLQGKNDRLQAQVNRLLSDIHGDVT